MIRILRNIVFLLLALLMWFSGKSQTHDIQFKGQISISYRQNVLFQTGYYQRYHSVFFQYEDILNNGPFGFSAALGYSSARGEINAVEEELRLLDLYLSGKYWLKPYMSVGLNIRSILAAGVYCISGDCAKNGPGSFIDAPMPAPLTPEIVVHTYLPVYKQWQLGLGATYAPGSFTFRPKDFAFIGLNGSLCYRW